MPGSPIFRSPCKSGLSSMNPTTSTFLTSGQLLKLSRYTLPPPPAPRIIVFISWPRSFFTSYLCPGGNRLPDTPGYFLPRGARSEQGVKPQFYQLWLVPLREYSSPDKQF